MANNNYFNNAWSNLVFNAGNAATQYAVSYLNWRSKSQTGSLKYISNSAYKSVAVHTARILAMSTLEGELSSLISKYQKYDRDKALKKIRQQQEINACVLIKNGAESTADYGRLECDGGHVLIAKTKYGKPIPEALILSFLGEESVHYEDVAWDEEPNSPYTIKQKSTLEKLWNPGTQIETTSRNVKEDPFDTKTVFHIDLAPEVSMNSTKNVVCTQVQGRDFTRKELVSGGDLTYSVSGNIVSDYPGIYPTEAVKRFVKIMQYNGKVDVNFITFGLLGIKQIIIKDFSLDRIEYKNIQPYSFTCVAVEPDDEIKLAQDTISAINQDLANSQKDAWYKSILDNKLAQMAATTALNTATNVTTSVVSTALDELVPNI